MSDPDPRAHPRLRLAGLALVVVVALWQFTLPASQILALVIVVTVHEVAHLVVARRCGMWARSLSVGFGPPIITIPGRRDTDYHVKMLLVGGAVDIAGMSKGDDVPAEREHQAFRSASWQHRALVSAVGPASNLLLAVILLFVVFTVIGVPRSPRITGISAPVPGLNAGDLVVKVGDRRVTTAAQASSALARPGSKQVAVAHDEPRSSETVTVPEGVILGFPAQKRLSPLTGLRAAAQGTAVVTVQTVGLVPRLLASPFRALVDSDAREDRAVSPIGMGSQAEALVEGGGLGLWLLVQAAMSILLGVVNLVPLLPLDGGRLVLAVAEGFVSRVRRAPVHLDGRFTMMVTVATVGAIVAASAITVLLDLVGA